MAGQATTARNLGTSIIPALPKAAITECEKGIKNETTLHTISNYGHTTHTLHVESSTSKGTPAKRSRIKYPLVQSRIR